MRFEKTELINSWLRNEQQIVPKLSPHRTGEIRQVEPRHIKAIVTVKLRLQKKKRITGRVKFRVQMKKSSTSTTIQKQKLTIEMGHDQTLLNNDLCQ